MVCELKDIDINKDSSQLLRDLYESCKASLGGSKKDPQNSHYILDFKSPYELVVQNITKICLFLVKVNSPFLPSEIIPVSPSLKPEQGSINEIPDNDEDEKPLRPIHMHHSFSSALESQISE